jgi:hypothetical protein
MKTTPQRKMQYTGCVYKTHTQPRYARVARESGEAQEDAKEKVTLKGLSFESPPHKKSFTYVGPAFILVEFEKEREGAELPTAGLFLEKRRRALGAVSPQERNNYADNCGDHDP